MIIHCVYFVPRVKRPLQAKPVQSMRNNHGHGRPELSQEAGVTGEEFLKPW